MVLEVKEAKRNQQKQEDETVEEQVSTRNATNSLFALFYYTGINMPEKNKTLYIIYSSFIQIFVTLFLPFAFTMSYVTSLAEMEIGNLLTSLQASINVYGCSLKFVIMGFMLKTLRKAELVTDKLDARCVDEDEKEEVRRAVKFGNLMVKLFQLAYYSYSTSTFLTAVLYGRPPYLLYIPFVQWKRSTKDFILASGIEYIVMNIACTENVLNDSYAVIYIGILRHHIQILLLRINKVGSDLTKTKEENTNELIKCIIDHKHIIELYDIVHPVISTTVCIQFLITAMILATTLINILMFADLSSTIASMFYIVAVSFETLPCCYFANCLMAESDQIGNVIFHSNWIEQNAKFRKMLVFFIQRAQKTITLTAGKLFPINLNSFVGIAKFSFSLYTLVNQMEYDKQK